MNQKTQSPSEARRSAIAAVQTLLDTKELSNELPQRVRAAVLLDDALSSTAPISKVSLTADRGFIARLALCPGGKYLAYDGNAGLFLQSLTGDQEPRKLQSEFAGDVGEGFWFSADGNRLYFQGSEKTAYGYSLSQGKWDQVTLDEVDRLRERSFVWDAGSEQSFVASRGAVRVALSSQEGEGTSPQLRIGEKHEDTYWSGPGGELVRVWVSADGAVVALGYFDPSQRDFRIRVYLTEGPEFRNQELLRPDLVIQDSPHYFVLDSASSRLVTWGQVGEGVYQANVYALRPTEFRSPLVWGAWWLSSSTDEFLCFSSSDDGGNEARKYALFDVERNRFVSVSSKVDLLVLEKAGNHLLLREGPSHFVVPIHNGEPNLELRQVVRLDSHSPSSKQDMYEFSDVNVGSYYYRAGSQEIFFEARAASSGRFDRWREPERLVAGPEGCRMKWSFESRQPLVWSPTARQWVPLEGLEDELVAGRNGIRGLDGNFRICVFTSSYFAFWFNERLKIVRFELPEIRNKLEQLKRETML